MCFLTNILDVKAYLSVKLSWFWSSTSLMLVCKAITWRAKHMFYCSTIIIIWLSCYNIFLIFHIPLSRLPWRSYVSEKFPSQSVATSLMEGEILKLNHWWNLIFIHCFRTVLKGTYLFFWGVGGLCECACVSLSESVWFWVIYINYSSQHDMFSSGCCVIFQLWRLGSRWIDCWRFVEETSGWWLIGYGLGINPFLKNASMVINGQM